MESGESKGEMMEVTSVRVESHVDEVQAEMEEAIMRALTKCGLVGESYAKLLCPVDTGRLRSSIKNRVKAQEQAVYIGTDVEYAPYVELGTRRQNAQPYLKPAVANHVDEYQGIIKDEMKSG